MSVRQYISYLQSVGLVDSLFGTAYCDLYEKAKYSEVEWSEKEYNEFMKLLTLLLKT
jgi:hypothetical protein